MSGSGDRKVDIFNCEMFIIGSNLVIFPMCP